MKLESNGGPSSIKQKKKKKEVLRKEIVRDKWAGRLIWKKRWIETKKG